MCKALGVSFMHLDWLKSCFLSLWFTFPSWRNKQTSKQATVIPLFLAVCSVLTFVSDSVFWSFANPSGIIVECFCLRGQSLNTKPSNVLKKKSETVFTKKSICDFKHTSIVGHLYPKDSHSWIQSFPLFFCNIGS